MVSVLRECPPPSIMGECLRRHADHITRIGIEICCHALYNTWYWQGGAGIEGGSKSRISRLAYTSRVCIHVNHCKSRSYCVQARPCWGQHTKGIYTYSFSNTRHPRERKIKRQGKAKVKTPKRLHTVGAEHLEESSLSSPLRQ
jgi:hypothetical protein